MFNEMTGNCYTPMQIYHYIETQQKITARLEEPWPTFDGAHKVLPPIETALNAATMLVLRAIWIEIAVPRNLGTDAVAYHEDVVLMIEREFARRTGISVPGMLLVAAAESERKRGTWVRLKDHTGAAGDFDDIDMIG